MKSAQPTIQVVKEKQAGWGKDDEDEKFPEYAIKNRRWSGRNY